MAEHRIRFRGGWEVEPIAGSGDSARFTLPTHWPANFPGPVRLFRRFGRPRTHAANESYRLELIQVTGIISLRLNGCILDFSGAASDDLSISLVEPLLERNVLEMIVDLNQIRPSKRTENWGSISLVIEVGTNQEH